MDLDQPLEPISGPPSPVVLTPQATSGTPAGSVETGAPSALILNPSGKEARSESDVTRASDTTSEFARTLARASLKPSSELTTPCPLAWSSTFSSEPNYSFQTNSDLSYNRQASSASPRLSERTSTRSGKGKHERKMRESLVPSDSTTGGTNAPLATSSNTLQAVHQAQPQPKQELPAQPEQPAVPAAVQEDEVIYELGPSRQAVAFLMTQKVVSSNLVLLLSALP